MKKILSITLATLMVLATLSACAPKEQAPVELTPEERTELYQTAIEQNGGEMVEYNPVVSSAEDDMAELLLSILGLTTEDMTSFGISLSPMNTKAYCIAAIMPAEGKEETVLNGVNAFVEQQQMNFEMYLVDQYEIAMAAKVETLEDGTVLLVMCEGQDTVLEGIKTALTAEK